MNCVRTILRAVRLDATPSDGRPCDGCDDAYNALVHALSATAPAVRAGSGRRTAVSDGKVGQAAVQPPRRKSVQSRAKEVVVMVETFRRAAARVACAVGSPWAFIGALLLVAGWALLGPWLDYSPEWQLVINTGTTIATFLMLFVLQNTQNRDTKAINIKLDELLRAIEGARTGLATVGDLSEEELDRIEGEFRKLAAKADDAADEIKEIAEGADPQRASSIHAGA
jgi:low affinity Fe/Cu permease